MINCFNHFLFHYVFTQKWTYCWFFFYGIHFLAAQNTPFLTDTRSDNIEVYHPEKPRYESGTRLFLPFNGVSVVTDTLPLCNLPDTIDGNPTHVFVCSGDVILGWGTIDSIKNEYLDDHPSDRFLWKPDTSYESIVIPYEVDTNVNNWNQSKIDTVIAYLNQVFLKRIMFIRRDKNQANYILFTQTDNSYSSMLGMVGGKQKIEIITYSNVGNIIHEIGHALGLLHEHQRKDVLQHLDIQLNYIMAQYRSNFVIFNNYAQNTPYDYNSLMHYACDAFSIQPALNDIVLKPLVTLSPKNQLNGAKLGQRGYFNPTTGKKEYFTPSDIQDILFSYPRIHKTINAGTETYNFFTPTCTQAACEKYDFPSISWYYIDENQNKVALTSFNGLSSIDITLPARSKLVARIKMLEPAGEVRKFSFYKED